MKKINIIELFSGIGGFSKGLTDAGFTLKKHYFSEIDKHAIANYKYNYPNAEYIGSVTDVHGSGIEQPDIITFGSPCQDFSLAGKRSGMEGQRSVLILEAIRIVRECRPSVFIWENVKGAFSSNNGADFWAIIAAFADIGGYRLEWQLLNTSWFLPQNRERIYLIGHLAGKSEPGVFPIGETDKFYSISNENCKKIYTNNRTALTQQARQYASWCGDFISIKKSNTKKGYEEANIGDSINFSVPNSKTRRGRVGKGVAQTLDTQSNQGVIITDDQYSRNNLDYSAFSPTITSKSGNLKVNRIRRLTEIECERLQGFQDDWTKFGNYDGVVKQIPKTRKEIMQKSIDEQIELVLNTVGKDNRIVCNEYLAKHMEQERLVIIEQGFGLGNDDVLCIIQPYGFRIINSGGWLKHLDSQNESALLERKSTETTIAANEDQIRTNRLNRRGMIISLIISLVSLVVSAIAIALSIL